MHLTVFNVQANPPDCTEDVALLGGLHGLQELWIMGAADQQPLSERLLTGLTSLTRLHSNCTVSHMQCINACTSLCHLRLSAAAESVHECDAAAWQALGRLTALTHLRLWNACAVAPTPECHAALGGLQHLQYVAARTWSLDVLSACSNHAQLTAIGGVFETDTDTSSSVSGVRFARVLDLFDSGGGIPFSAFPRLRKCSLMRPLPVAALTEMGRKCLELAEFRVSWHAVMLQTLLPGPPVAARVQAIKSLAALTHLRRVDFILGDLADAAALGQVASELTGRQLTPLDVLFLNNDNIRAPAIMAVAHIQGLQQLRIQLGVSQAAAVAADSLMAFSDMHHTPSVTLCVPAAAVAQAEAAIFEVRRVGLQLPKNLQVVSDWKIQ